MLYKKFRFFAWRYVVSYVLFLLPVFLSLRNKGTQSSLASLFLSGFGGPYAYPSFAVIPLFHFLAPNLYCLFLFSDFMREDCIVSYVYVFTRLGSKKQWLFAKTIRLLGEIALFFLVLFLVTFLLGTCFGLSLSFSELGAILPPLFLLNVGTIFLFSLLQNFISLPLGSATAFFITAFLYIFGCVLALLLYYKDFNQALFLFVLLPSNQMLLWHDAGFQIASPLVNNPISGFLPIFSYLVLGGYSLLAYWIFRTIFQCCDMSQLLKEAN